MTNLEAVEVMLTRVWADVGGGTLPPNIDPWAMMIGARNLIWIQEGPFSEACDLLSLAIDQAVTRQYYSDPGDNWLEKRAFLSTQ